MTFKPPFSDDICELVSGETWFEMETTASLFSSCSDGGFEISPHRWQSDAQKKASTSHNATFCRAGLEMSSEAEDLQLLKV